jgi:predicted permease
MFWRQKRCERDLERELRSHLEAEAEEQIERGLAEADARCAARRAVGNITLIKEDTRAMWGWAWLETLGQDVRYGVRTMFRAPAFTLIAVLTLAVGIGATTAIFSIVYGVLLRPLPYPDADRVALIHVRFSPQNTEYGTMSIADYLDWKARNHAFEDPAIFSNASWRFELTGAGEPSEVKGCAVTENFFSVLRSGPMLGRVFRSGDSAPTAAPAIVLSETLWRNHFGSNPAVIGHTLNLNGNQAVIIGVMPASFRFPAGEELWTNIRLQPPARRGPFPFIGIARLKPGITFERAQEETNAIGRQIERANPGHYRGMSMPVLQLRDAMAGKTRSALLVMFGAVFLVLLIATVNVANLVLVRSSGREREMAVRLSLGVTRRRLMRQLLTESLLLAGAGGLAGLILAWLGVHGVRAWNPGNLPRIEDIHLDLRALAFTVFTSATSAIFFGLTPAIRSSRTNMNTALKQSSRSGTANARKLRTHGVLVIAEIALSFTLLIGGGLLLRSFLELERVHAGFFAAPGEVLTMGIAPGRSNNDNSGAAAASYWTRYARMLDRIRNLPGVESVALSDSLPPDRRWDYDTFQIEGEPWTESRFPAVTAAIVSPGYFQTLGIPLLAGRYFTEADEANGRGAMIISESLARHYFPGSNPIGRKIAPSGPDNHNPALPVVGVVGDVKYTGLDSASERAFYLPYTESSGFQKLNLVVRSPIAPALPRQIEREIQSIDRNATVSDIGTLEAATSHSVAQPRFRTALLGGFAAVALLLSAIGIYGVVAYSVAQRTNEIGIRMALGAPRETVLKQIIGSGAVLAVAGIAIGCGGALLLTRALSSLLFSTSATDPETFASVTLIVLAVALLASLVPAVRATKIDPIVALRYE